MHPCCNCASSGSLSFELLSVSRPLFMSPRPWLALREVDLELCQIFKFKLLEFSNLGGDIHYYYILLGPWPPLLVLWTCNGLEGAMELVSHASWWWSWPTRLPPTLSAGTVRSPSSLGEDDQLLLYWHRLEYRVCCSKVQLHCGLQSNGANFFYKGRQKFSAIFIRR
jgi:hypothetical protein